MVLSSTIAVFTVLACCSTSQAADNIILFLTDDQDISTLPYLTTITSIFGASPVQFTNTFTTTPVCCTSRSVLLTGRLSHNNGAINNTIAGGCWSTSWQTANEDKTFAKLMQDAGYETFYAGKYLNTYTDSSTGGSRVPNGWDDFHGTGEGVQYGYNMSDNGVLTYHGTTYPDDYMPLVVQTHALNFLDTRDTSKPFIMVLAFTACHMPDDAEPKYQETFSTVTAPRTAAYNAGITNKNWLITSQGEMDTNKQSFTDLLYRKRLQTLATVQDIITTTIAKLETLGIKENTHLFYASDNGHHTGQFQMVMDKRLPYDTDVRVPIMWLPSDNSLTNVDTSVTKTYTNPIAIVDLAPTFLNIAGISYGTDDYDGKSLVTFLSSSASGRTTLLLEYRGESGKPTSTSCPNQSGVCTSVTTKIFDNPPKWTGSDFCFCQDTKNNSYNCLRIITGSYDQLYCEFNIVGKQPCEFYDLTTDPYQTSNTCSSLTAVKKAALSTQLSTLYKCAGSNCFSTFTPT